MDTVRFLSFKDSLSRILGLATESQLYLAKFTFAVTWGDERKACFSLLLCMWCLISCQKKRIDSDHTFFMGNVLRVKRVKAIQGYQHL